MNNTQGSILLTRDECTLVEKIRAGEKDLFPQLVQPHLHTLTLVCRSLLVNSSNVEDVVQETLLKAFVSLNQLHNESSFGMWLLRIGRNEALTYNRKERKYASSFPLPENQQDEQDWEESAISELADQRELPSEVFERHEFRIAVARALNSLSKKDRAVLLLHDVQDLTTEKATRVLGITLAAATSRLHRARRRLRQDLTQFGVSVDGPPGKSSCNPSNDERRRKSLSSYDKPPKVAA